MTHDPTDTLPQPGRVRFDALVAQRMREPFAWGAHDCCLFAADAVLALTGQDHAAGLRGTYTDAMGAVRVLQQLGGLRAVAGRVGPRVAPLGARVGDVGLVAHADRELLAVCVGDVWLAPGPHGLGATPLGDAICAWSVHA